MSGTWIRGMIRGILFLVAVMSCGVVCGQTEIVPTGKQPAFETISIKPNNSGMQGGSWGMTGRTFRGRYVTVGILLMQAYFPTGSWSMDRLKGLPSWANDEHYDVMATVDDTTAESWKGLTVPQQTAKASPMVLTMLMERCKLAAHKVPTEIQGYELVVSKSGPKMKPYVLGEPTPPHATKLGGDWMIVPLMGGPNADPNVKQVVTYLNISMQELADYLGRGRAPIANKTGLTGKYDLELPRREQLESTDGAAPAAPPVMDVALMFDWSAIGLEMKPVKVPAEAVVVDHLEKPTEN